jgi:signal transduction histidine kinase
MNQLSPTLFLALTDAAKRGALHYSSELCAILCREMNLKAATFYVATQARDKLILKGAHGFDYHDFQSLVLPTTSMAGKAFLAGEPRIQRELTPDAGFRDLILVTKHELRLAILLPISSDDVTIGVICLYPVNGDLLESTVTTKQLASFLSTIYLFAKERTKTNIRTKFVEAIGKSNDLNSMLHRLTKTLVDQLGVEAASIYTYDRNTKFLRLRATTGLAQGNIEPKTAIYFRPSDEASPTYSSFLNARPIEIETDKDYDKYPEIISGEKKIALFYPIRRIGKSVKQSKERICDGTLRVINRHFVNSLGQTVVPFSSEDYELIDFVAEMIEVLLHLFSGRETQLPFFEKIMHGTKSNLTASIQNLDLLEQRGKITSLLPVDLHYAIHDTKEWLLDIMNQMDRLESPARYDYASEALKIGGDVLAPVASYFQKSAASRGIAKVSFTNLAETGFFQLPEVFGDTAALITVFRNLAENALKYRKQGSNECRVELNYELSDKLLHIYFKDHGMGILEADRESVFDEGFRSDAAVAQDPSGTGLGLTQSREIMQKLQGDLQLVNLSPTTFLVTIEVKRR